MGDESDTIYDFDVQNDLLDLSTWGLSGFADLDVEDSVGGARISFNDGDALVLGGVDAASLDDSWAIWS